MDRERERERERETDRQTDRQKEKDVYWFITQYAKCSIICFCCNFQ